MSDKEMLIYLHHVSSKFLLLELRKIADRFAVLAQAEKIK